MNPHAPEGAPSAAPGTAIPPGAWLGLLGGGQLGRMFCMAAQSLGYRVAVLDPGAESPAGNVADRHLHADYLDRAGLARLAALVRAATTEFENVPAAALDFLSKSARVTPSYVANIVPETRRKSIPAARVRTSLVCTNGGSVRTRRVDRPSLGPQVRRTA